MTEERFNTLLKLVSEDPDGHITKNILLDERAEMLLMLTDRIKLNELLKDRKAVTDPLDYASPMLRED